MTTPSSERPTTKKLVQKITDRSLDAVQALLQRKEQYWQERKPKDDAKAQQDQAAREQLEMPAKKKRKLSSKKRQKLKKQTEPAEARSEVGLARTCLQRLIMLHQDDLPAKCFSLAGLMVW